MSRITPEILQKISASCSGQAMKIRIGNVGLEDIKTAMGEMIFQTKDAQDPTVFDDKFPTIVTGVDQLSHTAFVCFVSEMDNLRFRNILIFPTLEWRHPADDTEVPFWDRMGNIMEQKFCNRTQEIELDTI
jgi:hypothetical protein